jgi:hypothetical protein
MFNEVPGEGGDDEGVAGGAGGQHGMEMSS